MSGEFSEFVTKIIEVLEEKNTEVYHAKHIMPFDPPVILDLPFIGVVFTSVVPARVNEQQASYELHADIWYHYARFDAGLQKNELDDNLAHMVIWLMQNQTLKGFSLSNWVTEAGFSVEDRENVQVASGRVHLMAYKQPIDITWVGP